MWPDGKNIRKKICMKEKIFPILCYKNYFDKTIEFFIN
jgi:hypothetical protein